MTISLCMIAKDEEVFIGKALVSVRDFVDEIIVVDTGSKDRTIEIALSYGAIIKKSIWQKDFSYHRNESIKLATSDWILIMDCDEVLQIGNIKGIREIIDKTGENVKAYNLNIVNIINGKEIAWFKALRIFRNYEGFTFKGPIHEQVLFSIIDKFGEGSICELPLNIFHYGYDEEVQQRKDKRNRNLEILKNIEIKDGYFYAMMGDEYLQSNNLIEAEKNYYLSFKDINIKDNGYAKTLIVNYVTTLINLRKYEEAVSLISYVKSKLPHFCDLYFLEFWIWFYNNSYRKAFNNLEAYINLKNETSAKTLSVKNFGEIYNLEDLRSKCKSFL